MIKRYSAVIVILLLAIFTVLTVKSALGESLTYDEIVHIQEGKNAWLHHRFAIDTNNPPLIRELAVIPLLAGGDSLIRSPYPNIRMFPARAVIIGMGVLLGLCIYLAAKFFFGTKTGIAALFFYIFTPDILAHSHYVTLDMGATLLFFTAYMSLIRLIRKPSPVNFVLHGFAVGLMAASKITTLPFYVLSACIISPVLLRKKLWAWFGVHYRGILVSFLLCFLTIWMTYFFAMNVIVAPGDAKGRVSTQIERIANLQHNNVLLGVMQFLRKSPVPAGDYIGVIKNTVVRSTKSSPHFFLGRYYPYHRWYFMVVNYLLKIPLPLLVLFISGSVVSLRGKKKNDSVLIFIIPAAVILFVSAVSNIQPWIRYLLPVYPFVAIICALNFQKIQSSGWKIIFTVLCVWLVWSTLSVHSNYLSYTNEFSGPKPYASFLFQDANIDWGQSLPSLHRYVLAKKPRQIKFSYFGRDDAYLYGLHSMKPYGSYKFNEICAFHTVDFPAASGPTYTAISISNWYSCGYYNLPIYNKNKVIGIVDQTILIF